MDPNKALETLRGIVRQVHLPDSDAGFNDLQDLLVDLADAANALDEWLSKGGFLPAAWDRS